MRGQTINNTEQFDSSTCYDLNNKHAVELSPFWHFMITATSVWKPQLPVNLEQMLVLYGYIIAYSIFLLSGVCEFKRPKAEKLLLTFKNASGENWIGVGLVAAGAWSLKS